MRLIDADLIEKFLDDFADDCVNHQKAILREVKYALSKMPTVEAELVRHGRWEEKIKDGKLGYGFLTERFMACSVCGEKAHYDENEGWLLPRYCPNCGAKMDEVEE